MSSIGLQRLKASLGARMSGLGQSVPSDLGENELSLYAPAVRVMLRDTLVALAPTLMIGCQPGVIPRPNDLAPWTTELREAQPDDAFTAVYTSRGQVLVVMGAKHSTLADSLTFRLIGQAYDAFHLDTVIVEGPAYSSGANAERLLQWVDLQEEVSGFVQAGEIVPTVRGARRSGAKVWGGEPDDAYIRQRILAAGFGTADLLGFYTLRSVPQWIRQQKISSAADTRVRELIETELVRNRTRLELADSMLPDFAAWADWYLKTNDKPFGSKFAAEEIGPLADGVYGSNRIAVGISRARDEFLLQVIAAHWNVGENVMVVFGGSHLMILRPALDAMFGGPCYSGSDLDVARYRCN